jgi:Flp pilus assembly protein TadD
MPTSQSFLRRIPPGVWVFIGAFLIQFYLLNRIAGSRHFLPDGDDMKFYNDWAQKLMGILPWREGEPNYPGTAYYGLPGYAFALAGIYSTTGGYDHWYSPFLVAQLQAVFHAGTATFLFLIARRVFSEGTGGSDRIGTLIGVAAAGVWTAFTPAQVFTAILMPTSWVICAFWGVVYWLICIYQRKEGSWWRPWLWIGLLSGVSAMVVASILMLLPLVVIAIALTVGRGKGLVKRVGGSAGAVAVLMAGVYTGCSPVWIHNYFIAKDPVLLSAHDGLNFYLGNHATANGYTKIPAGLRASQDGLLKDSLSIPQRELRPQGPLLMRSEVSAYWKAKGRSYIRENRSAWMRLIGIKFANFWNAYQYDDLSILKLLRDEGAVPPGLRFGFVAAFGLAGLIFCFWRWPGSRWVAGAVLLHIAALMPVFITERYRLAAVPGLILLGCGGLAFLWAEMVRRRWAMVALYGLILAGATWFVSIPQTETGFWSLDYYKAGIRSTDGAVEAKSRAQFARRRAADAVRKGDHEEEAAQVAEAKRQDEHVPAFLENARRNLEAAHGYVQSNADIHFALGNVWFYRDDLERARVCYENALRCSPSDRLHDGALNNLGVIAIEQKRWTDAELYLLASLRTEPEDAKTWFNLARAQKETGNITKAEASLREAQRRDPSNVSYQALADQLKDSPKRPVP